MASGQLIRRLTVEIRADAGNAITSLGAVDEAGDRTADTLGTTASKADSLQTAFFGLGAAAGGLAFGLTQIAQGGDARRLHPEDGGSHDRSQFRPDGAAQTGKLPAGCSTPGRRYPGC
ncbi:hypothetical protein [Halomarina oriensis]|uniref:hypothetical protein n=1 Tax=Halomarina oriensis TaxID=671145 RepID=UPI001E2BB05A|nr:hypothetical protein [Halomarina oriensis]